MKPSHIIQSYYIEVMKTTMESGQIEKPLTTVCSSAARPALLYGWEKMHYHHQSTTSKENFGILTLCCISYVPSNAFCV